mgnify:FL=1
MAAALAAGALLWLSGRAPLGPVLGAMGFWHSLIGLGEGAITAGLVSYLLAVRPDLLARDARVPADARSVRKTAFGLGLIALVAVGLSFVASANPDGLEYVYERVGSAFGEVSIFSGAMPDYVMPGVANETLAGVLAGLVGLIVTGVLVYALLTAVRSRRAQQAE